MTTANPPTLFAVIIPHKDDVKRLQVCLDALVHNSRNTDVLRRGEVIVVDNNSEADLTGTIAKYPEVRFVSELEPGAAMARNRGVRETNADRIFFLDCDCVPDDSWLETAMLAIEDAEIVGGFIETFDETEPPRTGAQAFETVFAFRQKFYVEQKSFSVTANLLTWREIFTSVGDFRPFVSEDLEWCQRANRKNYKLTYDGRLKVAHPTRNDWRALSRKWRRLVDESFALHRLNEGSRLSWLIRAGMVLVSPSIDIFKVFKSKKKLSSNEKIRAATTLVRIRAYRALWMCQQALGSTTTQ
ncbi:glycosyltransferase [Roseibium sp. HPY-6]|uniref:glycosyltransferase family 2 protein n=1 Tax=Roseibium sp. HPY-6 TaxID=3229852 RepID=UPI00338FC601